MTTVPIPARARFRGHEHNNAQVCVVLEGGFVERAGHAWRDVGPGSVRVSGPAFHDIDFSREGARCLVLETETVAGAPALQRLGKPRFLMADGWLARVVSRVEMTASYPDPAPEVVLDGLAAELLAQLERRLDGRRSAPPPWLERVRELVRDTQGAVSVVALAREAGVHRVHLARAFRDHFGMPVTEYARRVRLTRAQRLLLTSSVPVAQVVARSGFADQSHLTRATRATLGVTPGAVRRARLHPFKMTPGVGR